MKSVKLFAIAVSAALLMSFGQPTRADHSTFTTQGFNSITAILWKMDVINLGKIPQGKPVEVAFEFSNEGTDPIVIANVATSCGCTIADYSKMPIKAGEKSLIKATYNAAAVGDFNKAITVTLADNEVKVLYIKGTVIQ
jgi:hypothetical protein